MIPASLRRIAACAAIAIAIPAVAAAQENETQDSAPAAARDTARRVTVGERTPAYDWRAASEAFRKAVPVFPADTGADTVRVIASTLRGPAGEEVRVRAWFGADSSRAIGIAKPTAPAMLRLAAILPAPGEYHGTFTLVVAGRPRTTAEYRVTWPRGDSVPAALEVRGTGTVAGTMGFVASLGLGGGRVTIPLTVVDSGGSAAVVRRPELESFARNAVADTAVQVDFGALRVLGPRGDTLPAEFKLQPDESRRVRLQVSGIRDAGRYSGSVRVAGKGIAPVVTPVTVYVRRSGGLALLLIALGVAISAAIRWYQQRVRPRLLRQRRAAELLAAMDAFDRECVLTGGVSPEASEVIARLRAGLERVYDTAGDPVPADDAGAAAAADANARLDLAASRLELLPLWVNAGRQIAAVPDPDVRKDLVGKLAPVRAALVGGTAEEVKTAGETVRSIPAAITTALRERLVAAIEAFETRVKDERAANPSADAFLKALEMEVQQRLAAAKDAAGADRLAEATARFDEARVAYADLLAKELQIRLGDACPPWMTQARWDATKQEVEDALRLMRTANTPDTRILAFEGALGLYLRSMAQALGDAAADTAKTRPGLSDEQKAALKDVSTQAGAVLARVAAGDAHGAAAGFAAAEKAYRDLLPTLPAPKSSGAMMGGITTVAPVPALGAATAVGGVPGALGGGSAVLMAPRPVRRLSTREIDRVVGIRDTAVSAVVGVIAIALGMSLLWAGKLAWGSVGDLFAAFFWGLGLHQAGTTAAGGTTGLLGQLLGKEPDAQG